MRTAVGLAQQINGFRELLLADTGLAGDEDRFAIPGDLRQLALKLHIGGRGADHFERLLHAPTRDGQRSDPLRQFGHQPESNPCARIKRRMAEGHSGGSVRPWTVSDGTKPPMETQGTKKPGTSIWAVCPGARSGTK